MKEAEIIDKAIAKFHNITGIEVAKKPDSGIIVLRTKPGIRLEVEGKNEIRQQQLPYLIQRTKKAHGKFIIISRYIPMPVKNILKNERVNYLETAGNCFIRNKDIFIYINDQKVTKERETTKSKLWNTAGLKFVFTILYSPELLNRPYRTMAEKANVALGTVGKLIEDLQKEGFVRPGKRNNEKILFLERKDELINKWTTMYNTDLRTKQFSGTFKASKNDTPKDWILPYGILWGGEMAGAKLTKFLTPEKLTLYTTLTITEVMKNLRIVPDPNGNIELLTIFWNIEINSNDDTNEMQIVPSLVAYADLLASYDSRNYETAERIKNKYFGRENKN